MEPVKDDWEIKPRGSSYVMRNGAPSALLASPHSAAGKTHPIHSTEHCDTTSFFAAPQGSGSASVSCRLDHRILAPQVAADPPHLQMLLQGSSEPKNNGILENVEVDRIWADADAAAAVEAVGARGAVVVVVSVTTRVEYASKACKAAWAAADLANGLTARVFSVPNVSADIDVTAAFRAVGISIAAVADLMSDAAVMLETAAVDAVREGAAGACICRGPKGAAGAVCTVVDGVANEATKLCEATQPFPMFEQHQAFHSGVHATCQLSYIALQSNGGSVPGEVGGNSKTSPCAMCCSPQEMKQQ